MKSPEQIRTLVFDIETDGFLDKVTKVHSICIHDMDADKLHSFGPDKIDEALAMLATADVLVGHNIIKYDIPVLRKLFPKWGWQGRAFDTIVATSLIWPKDALKDRDFIAVRRKTMPGGLVGKQSLEAWGYRLGNYKGDFKGPWEHWSPTMQEYCEQDVRVTVDLFRRIVAKNYSPVALDLEHRVAEIIAQQERDGWEFDEEACGKLYAKLAGRRAELESQLRSVIKPWYVKGKEFTPKQPNKKMGYEKDVTFTKVKLVLFNPSSRDHIINRLQVLFGWEPLDFTDSGKPKLDDEVIAKLPYPEAKLIAEYLMVQKRIGQAAEGDKAWLKAVRNGRIYGSMNTNGAVTGRAIHFDPNLGQVPANDKPYGHECRALFKVRPGYKLVGADCSGLELRMLAHFMSRWDGGKYGEVLLTGDIHTMNQQAAGLPTRANAKTFIYAFLYGAGDAKIGLIVGKGADVGKALKAKFLKQTPALKKLIEAVKAKVKQQGYLIGLDGRRLICRSQHSALNTLLQSAGALVCKRWLVEIDTALRAAGLIHYVKQVGWIHDEVQMEVKEEHAEAVGRICCEAAVRAGEFFKLRIPTAGEFKIGNNWAETH